jgi:hypothetical protein
MLSLAQFTPLLGLGFELLARDDDALQLSLVEAQALAAHPGVPRAPFSLVFEGPAEPQLPQATYALAHPAIGSLDIFLVPVAHCPAGIRYQAIFN